MRNRDLACLAALGCLGISVAVACGPDFPWQLLDNRAGTLEATPVNSFVYEVMRLAPAPSDSLRAIEPSDDFAPGKPAERARVKAEGEGLAGDQAGLIRAMREAADGEEALQRGATLPEAIRLYTAGAVDFLRAKPARAAERFEAVLRLPDSQRGLRTIWAQYMLGRIYAAGGDMEQASAAFRATRKAALEGAPDPLGLAVASYGEEAKPHFDRANGLIVNNALSAAAAADYGREIAIAVGLYAEQAARGSKIAADSLRIIARQLADDPTRLVSAIADPAVQRLVVARVLARIGPAPESVAPYGQSPGPNGIDATLTTLVTTAERQGIDTIAGADRMAALAYHLGRYDLAAALADKAPGALATWTKAKLALRRGDVNAATALYAEATRAFPAADQDKLDADNARLLAGEGGVLALTRGDYVEALTQLYPVASTYWGDVVHVAERVLTTDELKDFVDRNVPAPLADARPALSGEDFDVAATVSNPAGQLRNLLARRLMRDGRFQDAATYFDDTEPRNIAIAYATALNSARQGAPVERAHAYYDAAVLARQAGMEIMGYEAKPDYSSYDGSYFGGLGQDQLEGPLITDGERQRYAASTSVPDLRFHYRYIAVDQITRAADLLPPRSQAFAAVLCKATGWMMSTQQQEARVSALYARYVKQGALLPWASHFGRQCPEPDFAAAATTGQRLLMARARHVVGHYWWVGALLLGLAVAAWWRFRPRGPKPA